MATPTERETDRAPKVLGRSTAVGRKSQYQLWLDEPVPEGYVRCKTCNRPVRQTADGVLWEHSSRRGTSVPCPAPSEQRRELKLPQRPRTKPMKRTTEPVIVVEEVSVREPPVFLAPERELQKQAAELQKRRARHLKSVSEIDQELLRLQEKYERLRRDRERAARGAWRDEEEGWGFEGPYPPGE